jgi:hypothetical protein
MEGSKVKGIAQQVFVQHQGQVQSSKVMASGVLRRKCETCRKKNQALQRSPEAHDAGMHAFIEPRFAYDFSHIPMHPRSQGDAAQVLAHELPHVIQQSIIGKPTVSSAKVYRASALISKINNTVKQDADSSVEDSAGSISGKEAKCSDEVSFSLQRLKSSLEPDKRAVQLNADGRLIIPNIVFQLVTGGLNLSNYGGIKLSTC